MSYILDALKKSDQERKQGDVPNLQTVHVAVAPELKKPWVMYAVILFLLMALALLIAVMVLEKEGADLSLDDKQVPFLHIDKKNEVTGNNAKSEKMDAAIVEPETTVATTQKSEKKLELLQQKKPPVEAKSNKAAAKQQLSDINEIPYLQELDDYQQQLVPDMSFAGHVYSSNAASRSVIINGRAMSEGEMLTQGMSIEQITPRGVIFRFNDVMFRVDILQDWSFE